MVPVMTFDCDSTMLQSDVVVVGAGLGGVRTVQALRRLGFDGTVTVIGAESHEPYDRPPLSKEYLAETAELRPLGVDWADLDATSLLGREAVALDAQRRTIEFDDGTPVGYRTLVIATGSAPRRIPGVPEGAHVLRTAGDALRMRQKLRPGAHVAVIGAGFIGCEVASSARTLGLQVSLFDGLPTPLAGVLGPTVGAVVAGLHRANGVDVRCGVAVADISDRPWRVELADRTAVTADVVVEAIGVRPSCEWLDGNGLDLTNGVLCDEFGATTVPDVWAVGDVARWWHPHYREPVRFEHWTSAVEQASVLAHNILAEPAERRAYDGVPYFWSDQHAVKLQCFGRASPTDEVHVLDGPTDDHRLLALFARQGLVTGVLGMNRIRDVMRLRRHLVTPTLLTEVVDSAAA